MMSGNKIQRAMLALLVIAVVLGLTGCQRRDTKATPTPAVYQQFVPAVGSDKSPLPTPGTDNSPVKP
jgi:hypothetical protein